VSKEYDFTKKTGLRVLGLIENMSGFICPHCQQIQNIFGSGGGQSFCEKVSSSPQLVGDSQDQHPPLRFLGKIPIDVQFMKLMDQATNSDQQPAPDPSNLTHPSASSLNTNSLLIDRYFDTMSSKVFAEICSLIVQSITGSSAI
jgi:hypothetical protein